MKAPTREDRRRLLQAGSLVLLLGAHHLARGASVVAVRIWPAQDYTRVTIESDGALQAKQFFVTDPPRLAVDIEGIDLLPGLRELLGKVRSDDPNIAGLRVAQNAPNVVRLVIDLKKPITPQVFSLEPVAAYQHRLVFDLYPTLDSDPILALQRSTNLNPQPAAPTKPPVGGSPGAFMSAPGSTAPADQAPPGSSEQAAAAIARAIGYTQVSTSHETSPLMKLVSRGDTTVVDAYLSPVLRRYVDGLERALGEAPLFMQSNGGLTDATGGRMDQHGLTGLQAGQGVQAVDRGEEGCAQARADLDRAALCRRGPCRQWLHLLRIAEGRDRQRQARRRRRRGAGRDRRPHPGLDPVHALSAATAAGNRRRL